MILSGIHGHDINQAEFFPSLHRHTVHFSLGDKENLA